MNKQPEAIKGQRTRPPRLSESDGGQATVNGERPFIPYARQWIDEGDIQAVISVLRSDWLTQGSKVREFEEAFSHYVGSKYAVAINSGTAALHLACLAAGIGPGDEVITSPITFVATANCALYVGALSTFVDIDPMSFNLDPNKLEVYLEKRGVTTDNPACLALPARHAFGLPMADGRSIAGKGQRKNTVYRLPFTVQSRTKNRAQQTTFNELGTRAVIPVHFAGLPCDMPEIWRIARKFGLLTIEDACHALGAEYPSGERVGSCAYSDMTVFSFHPVKHITTGEGGMVTTNDRALYERLLLFRNHGITRNSGKFVNCSLLTAVKYPKSQIPNPKSHNSWYYEMQDLGFNYRMTDIQSALGISQLKKIDIFVEKRREIANYYNKAFKAFEDHISLPPDNNEKHAWHLYVIQIKRGKRDWVFRRLRENGIGVNVHYIPVYLHPYYQRMGYKKGICPEAEEYFARAITLPLFPSMKRSEMELVVEKVSKVLHESDD